MGSQIAAKCSPGSSLRGLLPTHSDLSRSLQSLSVRVGTRLSNKSRGSQTITHTSILDLLDEIDVVAKPQRASTAAIATRSELFLQYDAQHILARKNLAELGRTYGLTTQLIFRLRQSSDIDLSENGRLANGKTDLVGLECSIYIANLEHILLCLQQAAREALICCNIKLLLANVVRWYQSWKQRRHTTEAWFTEWPSGRRPLSTTWPWNIKPALVVLWGVCWMFAGDDDSAGGSTWNQAAAFPYFWTGPPHTAPEQSEACVGNEYDHIFAPVDPFRSPQAELRSRRANERNSAGITEYYTLPAFSASLASRDYISPSPSTTSASFSTLPELYPQHQGIDSSSNFLYTPASTLAVDQYQPYDRPVIQQPIAPNANTAPAAFPDARPSSQSLSYQANRGFAAQKAGIGLSVDSLRVRTSNMRDYPSPRSQMSGQSRSPSLSIYPTADVSPSVPFTTIPSRKSSTYSSPQSSKSEEPARNDQGQMYCAHSACSSDPPIFSRKCEWTKHTDKHTRPYICEERGCEKINGFTYSGGLLRHQREVHKKHGGPKASWLCPYKDCKRSTGPEFSRKENLEEHLRRRHRGVEEASKEDQMPKPESRNSRKRRREPTQDEESQKSTASDPKKRRKAEDDEHESHPVEDTEQASGDLQVQVRHLQQELQQANDKLQKLEDIVAKLTRDKDS